MYQRASISLLLLLGLGVLKPAEAQNLTNSGRDFWLAFSPNGDNINDELGLISICIETVDFFIMNRFGNKVFATNDPFQTKGSPAPVDTYMYFVKGITYEGEVLTDKGTITLIR